MQLARRQSGDQITPADASRVDFLDEHLRRLKNLPAHGNRTLTYDQLFLGLLISFYDPTVRSLRLIEGAGDFGGRLDLPRLARSTTADALAAFDPAHLQPIIRDLHRRAGQLRKTRDTLNGISWRIIAADGTYLNTLGNVAWVLKHHRKDGRVQGQVRLNVQMETQTWAPQVITVSGDDGSEPDAFAKDLLSDVLYLVDRNFIHFGFLSRLREANSHFILRVKQNSPLMSVVRSLPITPEDAEAGVVSDQIVLLSGRDAPTGEYRLVVIHATNRSGDQEVFRLLTDLNEQHASAKLIGETYHQRWEIELFFKWLKIWANMDHLWSTSRQGITFQFYVAVIGVLLMYLQLGRRVSRYAIVFLNRLLNGQMTLEQMVKALARLEREKYLARQRAAARRARKKLA